MSEKYLSTSAQIGGCRATKGEVLCLSVVWPAWLLGLVMNVTKTTRDAARRGGQEVGRCEGQSVGLSACVP